MASPSSRPSDRGSGERLRVSQDGGRLKGVEKAASHADGGQEHAGHSKIGLMTEPRTESAVDRAAAFGVDITLLKGNLRLTPTERVRRLQRVLASVVAIREQGKTWHDRRVQKE